VRFWEFLRTVLVLRCRCSIQISRPQKRICLTLSVGEKVARDAPALEVEVRISGFSGMGISFFSFAILRREPPPRNNEEVHTWFPSPNLPRYCLSSATILSLLVCCRISSACSSSTTGLRVMNAIGLGERPTSDVDLFSMCWALLFLVSDAVLSSSVVARGEKVSVKPWNNDWPPETLLSSVTPKIGDCWRLELFLTSRVSRLRIMNSILSLI
jgi:hypothetical protein